MVVATIALVVTEAVCISLEILISSKEAIVALIDFLIKKALYLVIV